MFQMKSSKMCKFQFIALFNCTVGNAVLGVPSENLTSMGKFSAYFILRCRKYCASRSER